MNDQLRSLLNLQGVDSELYVMLDLRERRPREMEREFARLRAVEAAVEDCAERIQQTKMEADKGELELKDNQAEVEKLQIALNRAKSNDEYQVLKAQIERLGETRDEIEETTLETLTGLDRLEEERTSAKQNVEVIKAEVAAKAVELEGYLEEVDGRIEKLGESRKVAVAGMNGDAMEIYNRVLGRYRESAIVAVEGNVCQGCHMGVTKQSLNLLMMGQEIVQCMQCMRILYISGPA